MTLVIINEIEIVLEIIPLRVASSVAITSHV
jgi:hypothetical protein